MGAKAEMSWKGGTDEGVRCEVYARRVGGEWRFFAREKRYDPWRALERPPLEDWLELLDAVQRRRSEEHTSELQSRRDLVCRLLLEKKKDLLLQASF